jgi:hypothetical protein
MSILICFALKEEAAPFRKIAAGKAGITILLTGIVVFENSPAIYGWA